MAGVTSTAADPLASSGAGDPEAPVEEGGRLVPDRTFFAVQRRFAERWAALASVATETAYLECTTWYLQAAGLDRTFDADNPTWRQLVAEVGGAADPDGVVHAAAVRNEPQVVSGPVLDWAWEAEDRCVRIHFYAERSLDRHPLALRHLEERQRELRDVVRHASLEHPDAAWFRGRSWLYAVEAYRRIFPQTFVSGLEPLQPELQFLACWGQLLDGAWRTRADVASSLLRAVDLAATIEELEAAFPFAMRQSRIPFRAMVAETLGN